MMGEQDRLAAELADALLKPVLLGGLDERHRVGHRERAIIMTPSIHGEQLPALVLGTQAEEARELRPWPFVQALNQRIIADSAAIHVVIAAQCVDRQARARALEHL